ncbi:thioredoxin family protein [Jeotgalibacillus marinus]|uniref:Thioredoxin family protein n=1 Tax=Jeotgalibacillus marinus TaxID=86667 RepID=A0ABV3Q204_9BACL
MFEQLTSAEQYEKTIGQDQPVLVKFYADWCPDCKRMDLFIGEVMEGFNSIPSFSIDKDEFTDIASKNDVMGIPSLLVFQNNQKLGHLHSANAKTPDEVQAFLEPFFS